MECVPHPGADKLKLTNVDIGNGEPLQIVCGAPNVASGQKVVVARVGTTIHPVKGRTHDYEKSKDQGRRKFWNDLRRR